MIGSTDRAPTHQQQVRSRTKTRPSPWSFISRGRTTDRSQRDRELEARPTSMSVSTSFSCASVCIYPLPGRPHDNSSTPAVIRSDRDVVRCRLIASVRAGSSWLTDRLPALLIVLSFRAEAVVAMRVRRLWRTAAGRKRGRRSAVRSSFFRRRWMMGWG
jgi:hypothetical protein